MPKRISGVSARLLECAKSEFLEKGFQDASIREIAKKADTSSRAVYTRFPNKEGLFDAIVGPATEKLIALYRDYGDTYWAEYQTTLEVPSFSSDPTEIYSKMMDHIFDHADEFRLAIRCLEGTRYKAMVEALTEINCRHLSKFFAMCGAENQEITLKILHLLTHTFYSGIFEPLQHGMNREEAQFYVKKLCDFFVSGVQGAHLS